MSSDSGASVAQRSQALGHSRADTYKHYQSQKVTIDVQSIFNYSDSKAEMIKEHGQTYLRRGAPTRLHASQKQVISEDPAIQLTRRQRAQLRLNLTDRYDGWKKAKADPAASAEVAEWKRLGSQIGNMTTRSRKLAFRGSLAQFHTMADVQLVSAQIKDESIPEVSPPIDASEHSIPERRWLAKNLPDWIENLGFEQLSPIELKISALEQMSQLCSLYERRKPRSSTPRLGCTANTHDRPPGDRLSHPASPDHMSSLPRRRSACCRAAYLCLRPAAQSSNPLRQEALALYREGIVTNLSPPTLP